MLFESLKKTLYAGVGLAFLTRDRIEELGKRMAEEAKLSETDGKKFIDEILKKSEEAKNAFEKAVNSGVAAALEKLDIPRRADIKALEARVKALEAKAFEDAAKGPESRNPGS
ncbi:MAG TPA: phasin family protein [Fibrobacteria bacterium]|nr:phasin family protein [Fibrobacteria bacterium]